MRRLAKKDFASADSLTHIPQGPTLSVNSRPTYELENPEQFDALCFAKMKLQRDGTKFDMVATSQSFFSFGSNIILRQTPCELEIMLPHIVLSYDVRLEN
jgi:hypothetical protein